MSGDNSARKQIKVIDNYWTIKNKEHSIVAMNIKVEEKEELIKKLKYHGIELWPNWFYY